MAVIGTSSINVQDIGTVLNEAGGSVDVNKPLTFFTDDANINKWAKFKPVIYPSNFRSNGEYNTEDKQGGLTIKYVLLDNNSDYTQSAILSLYSDTENWSYTLPQGGSTEPFRLGDFRGYQTNSYPLLRANYTKGNISYVTPQYGVFSYPYSTHLPYDSADSDGDGASYDVTKNLQPSDIDMYIEGAWFNLGDGYLACFVARQTTNPLEYGFDSFDLDSLRICDETLAEGGNYITITDFVTGVDQSVTTKQYWLVGGIVLKGGTYDIFLSMPYFDDKHYPSTSFIKETATYQPVLEVTGWSKYPTESVWHDIVWTQTEDYIAYPVSSNSYLKIRVNVNLSSWSSDTFTFTSSNTRIYCSTTGTTKYCSIYNSSFSINSSAGVITKSGTLYLGADDLFAMDELGAEYDIEIQVNIGNSTWKSCGWIGFEGSNKYT